MLRIVASIGNSAKMSKMYLFNPYLATISEDSFGHPCVLCYRNAYRCKLFGQPIDFHCYIIMCLLDLKIAQMLCICCDYWFDNFIWHRANETRNTYSNSKRKFIVKNRWDVGRYFNSVCRNKHDALPDCALVQIIFTVGRFQAYQLFHKCKQFHKLSVNYHM